MPTIWMDTYSRDYLRKFPEWTYMLWTEKEIDAFGLKNREFYDREPKYAVKSDIVRFELLHRYGGIYVDADSVWVNDKDYGDLIQQSKETGMFVGVEPDIGFGTIYAGGIMGSVPEHEILTELVRNIKVRYERYGDIPARHVIAGPPYITETISQRNCEGVTIFPSMYFYPMFWAGIPDVQYHKRISVPRVCYSFQYGYTTSNLQDKIRSGNNRPAHAKTPHKELNGYCFFSQLDSPGHDLFHIPDKSVEELKEVCDHDDTCEGFNTNGWIKWKIVPEVEMSFLPFHFQTHQGLYVKTRA